MNREYKFRAYDVEEKKMYTPIVTIGDAKAIMTIYNEQPSINFSIHGTNLIINERLKFMQYTGLKDRNGKEIYEHSILRDKRGMIYKVQELDYYIESGNNLGIFIRDGFEVIGNSFENLELLNQQIV